MKKKSKLRKTRKDEHPAKATAPKCVFRKKMFTSGTRFYKAVPFDVWWNEFFASRKKDGSLQYPTAWNFIKSKTEDPQERTWLWMAIGATPKVDDRKKRAVPHLGDWQKTRDLMLTVENPEVKKMADVLKQRLDGIEAGRGVAHVVLKLVQDYMHYDERIDQVFGKEPVLDELSEKENEQRAAIFFSLKRKTTDRIMRFLDMYLKCHGISADDMSVLANAAAVGAQAALRGVQAGAQLPDKYGPVLPMMMKSMIDKAHIFNMQLPDGEIIDMKEAETEKEPARKNGHG